MKVSIMMQARLFPLCLTLALLVFALGCAKKTTVVLLSDPDGKVGQVSVQSDSGSVDISKPAESTVVAGREAKPSSPRILTADEIERDYGDILSALPDPPVHFILYFETDTTLLTQDSIDEIPEILRTIHERKSDDISVVGHSDTAGDNSYNMKLSTSRAVDVTTLLINNGVKRESLKTTSHGENNPLIKTPDNTSEPKNRRVEVVVR